MVTVVSDIKWRLVLRDIVRIFLIFVVGIFVFLPCLAFLEFVFFDGENYQKISSLPESETIKLPQFYEWSATIFGLFLLFLGFHKAAYSDCRSRFGHMSVIALVLSLPFVLNIPF